MTLAPIARGTRVRALHPGIRLRRDTGRYGEVVSIGRRYVHVRMDKSGRIVRFHPGNLAYEVTA